MTDVRPASAPRPMGVRDVLRIPSYRNLFGGQVVSDIGDGITLLLLLLVINDLTGSKVALALMAIAEALSGPERRRRWSDEQRQEIIEASLAPGAVLRDVARLT